MSLSDLEEDDRAIVEPLYQSAATRNILMTLANHPRLLREWLPITRYVFNQSTLDAPDVELICLRTTWCYGADYEYTHHASLALTRGLSSEQIDQVPAGAASGAFDDKQKTLLKTVDMLLDHRDLDDTLYGELSGVYSGEQILDIVVTCGNYATIALVQKTLRVQLENSMTPNPHFPSSIS